MLYLKYFFVYSILGYLFEGSVSYLRRGKFESGILFGPWTPIYGIGVIFVLILSNFLFSSMNLFWWLEVIIVFLTLMLVMTFIEWLAGLLIEYFFGVIFWNYTSFKYNFGKYIALEVSLVWGLLSMLIIYVIHPFLSDYIRLIPSSFFYILVILLILDYILIIKNGKVHK